MNTIFPTIAVILIFGMAAVSLGINFYLLPKATKIANLKEWLKYGVTEAEKALGAGTGQLKLRLVYNMAIEKFPWLTSLVTFNTFSNWVDEALEWMKAQLAENSAAQEYVNK